MTIETNAQDEAKKIWDQLDAEDSGDATPVEQPARDEPVAERSATQVEQPQASEEDDNDPKKLREKLAGLESIVGQLTGRLRNAEGHIGGLNSQLKEQLKTAQKIDAAGGTAPTAAEISAAQSDPQALADLERDYPEFAKAVKGPMDALRTQMAELQSKIQQPPVQPDGFVSREEIAQLRSEMKVESKHEGWQETVNTPEFHGWVAGVPREVQMLAVSKDPKDAIRLLDLFSESRKPRQTTQRHQAAAALPTGQRSTVRTKNVDDMTPQEYWRYLDDIDKSKG
jgi:hypothetical protein